jgi:hypothetical protein
MNLTDQQKATTVGEELWNVHLRRQNAVETTEEDFDHSPRKRAHSVGEELWGIHVKRSGGIDLSFDKEGTVLKNDSKQGVSNSKVVSKHCRYNLRNRGSQKKKE